MVAACVARRKLRSATRLAGKLQAVGCSGEMRELAGIGAPTFEIQNHLAQRQKSGCRSAQAVERTKNRISRTNFTIDNDGEPMDFDEPAVVARTPEPWPNPTSRD